VAAVALPDDAPSASVAEAPTERKENTEVGVSSATEEAAAPGDATAGGGNGDGAGTGGSDVAGVGGGAAGLGTPGPYQLGNGIEPPRKIKDVAPTYPTGAWTSRTRGAVLVEVVIGADGLVHNAKVLRSIPLLDQAAIDAVRQWEFRPAKLNGVAVAVIVTILVQFSIY
jgi:protein TonB